MAFATAISAPPIGRRLRIVADPVPAVPSTAIAGTRPLVSSTGAGHMITGDKNDVLGASLRDFVLRNARTLS
jgi:hypothetical protein